MPLFHVLKKISSIDKKIAAAAAAATAMATVCCLATQLYNLPPYSQLNQNKHQTKSKLKKQQQRVLIESNGNELETFQPAQIEETEENVESENRLTFAI